MNKVPKHKSRAGWKISPRRLKEACDALEIKLPVHIRYQSGKYTVGTHRPKEDDNGKYYHGIAINQNVSDVESANETLLHELIHAVQAERFHFKTGKEMTSFYSEDYRTKNGPHGVKYWSNKYEIEARERAYELADERMLLGMPDSYGFNHLTNWGAITVECIEVGCEVGGPINQWPEDRRKEHYLTHEFVEGKPKRKRRTRDEIEADALAEKQRRIELGLDGPIPWGINADGMRVQRCIKCGNEFEQPRKKGRPKHKCETCEKGG